MLIANSNLVGDWATWPEFRRLEHLGLTMYGQMTAGSWIYIGTQGIVQGTYETFAAIADKRYGGTLAGTLTLTGGCGGMGGAQPLAVTLNGAPASSSTSTRPGCTAGWSTAISTRWRPRSTRRSARALAAKRERRGWSVGVVGNAAEVFPSCSDAGWRSTSSPTRPRRTTRCLLPVGISVEDWAEYAEKKPESSPTAPGSRWPGMSRRWSASWTGSGDLRLRQLDPRRGLGS